MGDSRFWQNTELRCQGGLYHVWRDPDQLPIYGQGLAEYYSEDAIGAWLFAVIDFYEGVNTMDSYEKMISGQLFNQTDLHLLIKMARTYCLVRKLNRTSLINQPKRNRLLKRIFGSMDGNSYYVQSPLYIDYGFNTHIGKRFLSNYNFIIQDEGLVHIGDDVMIGPNVTITTNLHPFVAEERKVCWVSNRFPLNHKGNYVRAKPVSIGHRVWICSGATICPGVTIGNDSIIGAGSVVTKDIPPGVLAYGVPCRVVRPITDEDRVLDSSM